MDFRSQPPLGARVCVAMWLTVMWVLALVPVPSAAQIGQDEAFIVTDVAVDVTAETASAARDQAFLQGQRQALARLMARQANLAAPWDTAGLSDDAISQMVQGFQVDRETASAGRYQASLTYLFQPDPVRRLLAASNLQPAPAPAPGPGTPVGVPAPGDPAPVGPGPITAGPITAGPGGAGPVVVLPVLGGTDGDRLWDSPNPWREAWLNLGAPGGGPELIVPFGDLQDIAAVSVDQATTGDAAALQAIASQYGATETVVAVAEPAADGGLDVILTRHGGGVASPPVLVQIDGDGADAPYGAAVARAARVIAETPPVVGQPATAVDPTPGGPLNSVVASVPLRVQADWFQTWRRLQGNARIAAVDVVSMSAGEVIVELSFYGGPDDLRQALTQQGLRLELDGTTPVLRRTEDATVTP